MKSSIKNYFKYITFPMFILFSAQCVAVTVSDGIAASENDDNAEAVKIWSKLARSGNTLAQYNLATHYSSGSGVQKNKKVADKWLKGATRSGLVQAYLNLNKKAVTPAKGIILSFNVDPELWLQKQEGNKYTIQIASSRNKKSIKKAYGDNNFRGEGGYYHYARNGVERYGLIYGTYKTVAAANKAIAELPKYLRIKKPWVRKIKSLQNISK
ncbi:MAG: SPOR domain-containing protein [Gammaproteobacteria bacterium]|nr:SPOR domain-containing protein [Gammaproteobacteria bacterium]